MAIELPIPAVDHDADIVGTRWSTWCDELTEAPIGMRYRLLGKAKDGTVLSVYCCLAQNQVEAIEDDVKMFGTAKHCQPLIDAIATKALQDMDAVAAIHGGYDALPADFVEGL